MANSTFRQLCERVLKLTGRNVFASDSEFNNGNIDAEKATLKELMSLANQRYVRTQRGRALRREFTFNTADGDNSYPLNPATSIARLVPKSWYITTAGSGRALKYFPGGYYAYKAKYPEGEDTEGVPVYWFDMPPTDASENEVGFSPPPDGVYAVKYSGYLRPIPLTQASDVVVFPVEFEDGLVTAAAALLTLMQGEGKYPDLAVMLDPIFAEIEQNDIGPLDEQLGCDLGISIDAYGIY